MIPCIEAFKVRLFILFVLHLGAIFHLVGQTPAGIPKANSTYSESLKIRLQVYSDTLLLVDFFDLPTHKKNAIRIETLRLCLRADSLLSRISPPFGIEEQEKILAESIDSLDLFAEALYEGFLASMISNGVVTKETYTEEDLDSLENSFAASGFSREISGGNGSRSPSDKFSQPISSNSYFLASGRGTRQQLWRGTDQSDGNGSASLSLLYRFGFGLRIGASGLFIPNQTSLLDQSTISIGYSFPVVEKLKATFSYSHSFFSIESAQNISALNNDFTVSLSYNNELFFLSSSFTYTFGKQTVEVVRRLIPLQVVNEQIDAAQRYFYLSLSKPLIFDNVLGNFLVIEPSFDLSFGTIPKYVTETRQVRRANGTIINIPRQRLIDNSLFAITNYDINLFISFDLGFITLDPEIGYSIPVNQEGASNIFNAAIGFSIIL